MDRGEKVSRRLVVARRDGAKLLELAIEILHEMAGLVHLLVESAFDFAVALGRDDKRLSCRPKRVDDALVGVEGFVRQEHVGFHLRQQRVGPFQIMGLAGGQDKGQRIAQRVDQGVDFGAQASLAAPDRLIFACFFWAPALCWWARTIVESIIAYSLSASLANISNSFFHTPVLAQRENRV